MAKKVKTAKKAKAKSKPKTKPSAKKKPAKKVVKKPAKAKKTVKAKVKAKAKKQPKTKVKKTKPVSSKKVVKTKVKPAVHSANGSNLKKRYSDKDLTEFKQIITSKLTEAKRDLDLLRSSMSHIDDHGTDDTSPTFKLMEDGSDVLTKEETAQLAARQQKFIKHLEDAMVRIENKSYGICRVTGNLIPKERLRVVPHATLSIEAKQKQF